MKHFTNKNQIYKLLILAVSIISISKFTYATNTTKHLSYRTLVEQNKTWWYKSGIQHRYYTDYYYFGVKIEGDTIIDDTNWSKCWLINVEKKRILPCPIALIREEDKKVYRYPYDDALIETRNEYLSNCENEYYYDAVSKYTMTVEELFKIQEYNILAYDEYMLSPEKYPLYDFSTEIKQQVWPWSYFIPDNPDNFNTGRFEVPRIITDEDNRCFQAHRMLRLYEIMNVEPNDRNVEDSNSSEYLIVEGVGIHKLESTWSSTFLIPVYTPTILTGCGIEPLPTLVMVTLDNDSEVYFKGWYGQNFTLENAVYVDKTVETSENTETIYDLMGKKIKKPLANGIYIFNGKKILRE